MLESSVLYWFKIDLGVASWTYLSSCEETHEPCFSLCRAEERGGSFLPKSMHITEFHGPDRIFLPFEKKPQRPQVTCGTTSKHIAVAQPSCEGRAVLWPPKLYNTIVGVWGRAGALCDYELWALCGIPLIFHWDVIKQSQLLAMKPRRMLTSPALISVSSAVSGHRPYTFSWESSMIKKDVGGAGVGGSTLNAAAADSDLNRSSGECDLFLWIASLGSAASGGLCRGARRLTHSRELTAP